MANPPTHPQNECLFARDRDRKRKPQNTTYLLASAAARDQDLDTIDGVNILDMQAHKQVLAKAIDIATSWEKQQQQ